jgi:hypothetical protein
VQTTGDCLHHLVFQSFWTAANHPDGWHGAWTVFYWGWWMAWPPFVGLFIARISRGRKLREFVMGVLLAPVIISFVWLAVLGGTGLHLEQEAGVGIGTRRIGLGVTGLADALIMLGLDYDSDAGRELAATVIGEICHGAYRASIELGREKGAFPYLEREPYLEGAFVAALPDDIRDNIARRGIRNSHLLAIAPTGTVSLLAGNVSSGIEPVYAAEAMRQVLDQDGNACSFEVLDYALQLSRDGGRRGLPPGFVRASDLARSPICVCRRAAALRRQRHLQDHQRPRGVPLRGLPAGLRPRLRSRPRGLHDLSPQPDHRCRARGRRRPRGAALLPARARGGLGLRSQRPVGPSPWSGRRRRLSDESPGSRDGAATARVEAGGHGSRPSRLCARRMDVATRMAAAKSRSEPPTLLISSGRKTSATASATMIVPP